MKSAFIYLAAWACVLMSSILVSCTENDEPELKIPTVTKGAYILNQGKIGHNNSSISYYDIETKQLTPSIFEARNGKKLGDTGQDMLIYGAKMYIAVHGSNYIAITDLDCNLIDSIKPVLNGKPQGPRYLATHAGKVYVTLWDGYVARIDTSSLRIDAQVKVGKNPEQLVVSGGNLYVANSGGMNYPTYDNTVSVVNTGTFTLTKSIPVVINPVSLTTDSQGDVYLISNGNYNDIPNTLQLIDTKSNTSQAITTTNATFFTSTGTILYMLYSQWDEQGNLLPTQYITYDALKEKVIAENFITDGTRVSHPYHLNNDVSTGNIYITVSDYIVNGDMYTFSPEGKKLDKLDTGGLNPCKIAFVTK